MPAPEIAAQVLAQMFSHPGFYCMVAELNGEIVGSNCMDERNLGVAGIGPLTVAPKIQNRGIGRMLMQAALQRTADRRFAGVRLIQAGYHNRVTGALCRAGLRRFANRLAVLQGSPLRKRIPGFTVRAARHSDLEKCSQLCRKIHGHDRGGELFDAIKQSTATVVERNGELTGYATCVGFFGHAVGETNVDIQALIAAAESFPGPGFLIPTRNTSLFRWCLENGLRIVQPMTLMATGLYNQPTGAYLPSILF